MRNLKAFGLALIAMLAMGAVAASAATADEFTAEKYPVVLTGNQDGQTDIFTTTSGTVSCKTVSYTGTVSGPTTTVTVTPKYTECTGLGFPAEVHMNGCDYLIHIEGGSSTTSKVDIVCPPEKEITVTAVAAGTTKCTIHVPPQNGLTHMNWTNVQKEGTGPSTREVTGHIEITNLTYKHTEGTGLGKCTTGHGIGSYKGKATVTGENHAGTEHIGIFFS